MKSRSKPILNIEYRLPISYFDEDKIQLFVLAIGLLFLIGIYTSYHDDNYSQTQKTQAILICSFLSFICLTFAVLMWPRLKRTILVYPDRMSYTPYNATLMLRRAPIQNQFADISSIRVEQYKIELTFHDDEKFDFIDIRGMSEHDQISLIRVLAKYNKDLKYLDATDLKWKKWSSTRSSKEPLTLNN